MQLSRDTAWELLTEYTKGENLRKHALAVEAAVRGYARLFGEDETLWGVVGLLHDFDYERWPSLDDHPFRGSEILREQDYPEVVSAPSCRTRSAPALPASRASSTRCSPATRWPGL